MFMQSGFSDFLAKPIELHKLNAALHRWLPAEKKVAHDRNAGASRQQQRQQ
jgi:DNA-binding NtrC family response regulator